MNDAYSYSGDLNNEAPGDGILSYLPSILWQRRWWIGIPLVLFTLAGLLAAFLLPSTYRSSATLLVESPQLPVGLPGAPQTSVIDQRIAKVRQQVLSRPDLIELVENNNLYPEERQREPLSAVLDTLRKSTSISPVSADIGAPGGSNTIAFSLTFDYPDPQKAQVVAQDFVERLLKLDVTQTTQQAANTVEFLQDQANGLSTQINTIESQISRIKAVNGSALSSAGMMMMPTGSGGYQAQIAQLQRDNAVLNTQLRMQTSAVDRDPSVIAAEGALAGARAMYSDSHPDVRNAEVRVAEAKKFAAQNIANTKATTMIQQQIDLNNKAIGQLQSQEGADSARIGSIMSAQSKAPAVNEQITQLQAKADGLRGNYQTIATQLMNARGAAKLGEQQKGERLTVIDPPVAADRPSWPNRPLFILGGIALGGAIGLGLAFALEFIMRPIRGVAALQQIIGEPPMVIVPQINANSAAPKWWQFGRRRARAATAMAAS